MLNLQQLYLHSTAGRVNLLTKVHQNAGFCTYNFKNIPAVIPLDPTVGGGNRFPYLPAYGRSGCA